MARSWLSELGPEVEIDCVNGLRSFASKVPDGIAARWSLFAGSGVGTRSYAALQAMLGRKFGINVVFDTAVHSEINPEEQQLGDVKKLRGPS
eukprot:3484862-Pyramimonas_sp.AAC.1